MAKKMNTDVVCPNCGSTQLIVGRSYTSGGSISYVMRCAHCCGLKGEPTFVRNINSAVYQYLMSQGKIVARFIMTNSAVNELQNIGSEQVAPSASLGTVGEVAPYPASEQADTAPVEPSSDIPFDVPIDMPMSSAELAEATANASMTPVNVPNPNNQNTQFYQTSKHIDVARINVSTKDSYTRAQVGLGIASGGSNSSAVPPMLSSYVNKSTSVNDIPAPPVFGAVASAEEKPEVTQPTAQNVDPFDLASYDVAKTVEKPAKTAEKPVKKVEKPAKPAVTRPDNCPVCKLGKAVRVPSSNYSCYINSGFITYYTEGTGAILFTHKVSFCPFCGNNLA